MSEFDLWHSFIGLSFFAIAILNKEPVDIELIVEEGHHLWTYLPLHTFLKELLG